MCRVRSEASLGLRSFVVGLAAAVAAVTFSSNSADARYHRGYVRYARHAIIAPRAARAYRHVHAEGYSPPTSAIVVDGNTGAVLHASNAEALRHPASLTKIMTLYLLFERLEAGKIRLDTPLKVSEHASEQAPTKLGLKPGQTIAVEDAIKAVVTKSANDAAVAIAENLGGDEEAFAKLMTEKAHALGMSRTTYVNASGLPDDDQVTQRARSGAARARDPGAVSALLQILLDGGVRLSRHRDAQSQPPAWRCRRGRRHQNRIHACFGLQSRHLRSPRWALHRRRRAWRPFGIRARRPHARTDQRAHQGSVAAAQRAGDRRESRAAQRDQPVAFAKAPLSAAHAEPATTATLAPKAGGNATAGTSDQIQPLLVKTITYRTAPLQTASLAPLPTLVPAPGSRPQPAAAAPVRTVPAAQSPEPQTTVVVASTEPAPIASAPKAEPAKPEPPKAEQAKPASQDDPA